MRRKGQGIPSVVGPRSQPAPTANPAAAGDRARGEAAARHAAYLPLDVVIAFGLRLRGAALIGRLHSAIMTSI